MPAEIIKQLNWIDIFVVISLLRIIYISTKNGMPLEFFKLLGTLLACYLSLHYYALLVGLFKERLPEIIPLGFFGFLFFIIIAVAAYLAVALLRQIFFKLIKVEPVPKLNKWAGVIFGGLRGFLLLSLIFFSLVILPLAYPKESVGKSYSGKFILKIAPLTYNALWNGFASKFSAKEKFNNTILEIQNSLKPSPQK